MATYKKSVFFFASNAKILTYYLAESLSWYSLDREKHSWTPLSTQSLFIPAKSSSENGSVSSIRETTSMTILASPCKKYWKCCYPTRYSSLFAHYYSCIHNIKAEKQEPPGLCPGCWCGLFNGWHFHSTQWAQTRKKFQFQMCVSVVARIHKRLKSTFFDNFFDAPASFGNPFHLNFFQKTLILVFEANSALSCQNGIFPAF